MARTITLTRGYVATVDDEDYSWLNQWQWQVAVRGRQMYAVSHYSKYVGGGMVYMHRFIVDAAGTESVDHHNHDGLDNRRSNLRVCTRTQNAANQVKTRGTSRYKGVSRQKGYWRSTIKIKQKQIALGYFHSEEHAARAYDAKAAELFKEFAHLNFPDELSESRLVAAAHYADRKRPVHLEPWQRRALVRAREEVGFSHKHLAEVFGVTENTSVAICQQGASLCP